MLEPNGRSRASALRPQSSINATHTSPIGGTSKGERMRVSARHLGPFVFAGLLATMSSPAAAQTYTFVNVADSTGPYSVFGPPALSDAGAVAFGGFRDAGGNGIFTGPDAVAHAVATTDGPYSSFGFPAINGAGAVGFRANRDAGGSGIFTGPDPLADVVATTDGPYASFGADLAFNGAGAVAFFATRDAGGSGIFTGPDLLTDTIATTDGPYSGFNNTPAINDAGTVAFTAGR